MTDDMICTQKMLEYEYAFGSKIENGERQILLKASITFLKKMKVQIQKRT